MHINAALIWGVELNGRQPGRIEKLQERSRYNSFHKALVNYMLMVATCKCCATVFFLILWFLKLSEICNSLVGFKKMLCSNSVKSVAKKREADACVIVDVGRHEG
jgi:hypothetical protein